MCRTQRGGGGGEEGGEKRGTKRGKDRQRELEKVGPMRYTKKKTLRRRRHNLTGGRR